MLSKHALRITAVLAGVWANYYYHQYYQVKIEKIYIEGCKHFPASLIHYQIQKHLSANPLEIRKIQQLVNQFDYVSRSAVRVEYPNTLWVHVLEKTPIAQTISQTSEGNIVCSDLSQIKSTPLFSSKLLKIDAVALDQDLQQFLDAMKKHNIHADLCTQIRPGRWDLVLNGKIIKLPDAKEEIGLLTLKWFIRHHRELYENASQVDLRKIGYVMITEYSQQNLNDWIASI